MIYPILCVLSAAGLVVIDQLIKLAVVAGIPQGSVVPLIPHLLQLQSVRNYGAAFSMLSGRSWVFIVITAVVCGALLVGLFAYPKHNWLSYIGCSMIIAGGIGNLIDRLSNEGGYVVDYIRVTFFPAVFNFADILVVVGVFVLLLYFILFTGKKKQSSDKPAQ